MHINERLLQQAKEIVLTEKYFSISFLQRKMGVSYSCAASLMYIIKRELNRKELGYRRLISKKHKKIYYIK